MRDLLITAIIIGSIPFILRSPFVGLLMWVWLSIMNPHRLSYGFAFNMPFAQIVAVFTFVGILFKAREVNKFPINTVTVLCVAFVLWISVSPIFAFHPEEEFDLWSRAIKVQVMCLLALLLVKNRAQLQKLYIVLTLSIGFWAVKGGAFTVITAGGNRVWGPPGSFIADNNQLALAVVMGIPLLNYLRLQAENIWIRRVLLASILLAVAGALGSQSRGALISLVSMGLFLLWKSRNKWLLSILILMAIPLVISLMPDSWTDRMSTIKTYDQDASAMGRINAWFMAWNLAVDRFPIGGGFATWAPDVYLRYAPEPTPVLVAHSIYFHILGDHGFIGLAIFLAMFLSTWLSGSWVNRQAGRLKDLTWAGELAAMNQVSLIGYLVGGAFLSLTYFDLPYYVVIGQVLLREEVYRHMRKTRHVLD